KVVADDSAPGKTGHALMQTAAGPNALFNVCVRDAGSFKDGEISVRMKAVRGELDQGGGIIWRYKDANNYYITRYNPLEKNFRVYHVVAGKRTQLATKEDLEVPAKSWITVEVKQTGEQIECRLNGKTHLTVKDATIKDAGKIGIWTKADAQSEFDMLTMKP